MEKREIDLSGKTVFITGAAGFIGSHLTKALLSLGLADKIIGVDNMNDYYDVSLKEERLKQIALADKKRRFQFIKGNICDKQLVEDIMKQYHPAVVVNLAAQAGVRYSIDHPDAYIESNIIGFYNILEACRHSQSDSENNVEHLVYASSSSVYGNRLSYPYRTEDGTDCPVSLYAATKKSDEILAYAYAKLYGIPSTGLRFFTVYGPQGRPDMAYYSFADKWKNRETIKIYNYGKCKRDFTYIDDIVNGITAVMQKQPIQNKEGVKYKIYNLGNNHPETLLDFVRILQEELVCAGVLPDDFDFEGHKEYVTMQPGDVEITYADISESEKDFGFTPKTSLQEGIRKFAQWYAGYTDENQKKR